MADDDIFTADRNFAPVEANSVEIKNGTFTLVAKSPNPIEVIKKGTAPDANAVGTIDLKQILDSFKYRLTGTERLYVRSVRGPVAIGVITA